ncbi:cation-dependent mannose-6-phosphate receptor-like [Crassostrea angulata]|uniref:MRH domain-containing protein n=2 Tax=Magallana gigas TaxID=29159 RepID=A0A8W8KJE6_MAGGI|nr:cation-dependent mannose-6-phosphate receptor [Crassostrea gigas]XP_052714957.1 cation-dependent mannose-6-phosphate receptor-like [Crassostrea angulata]
MKQGKRHKKMNYVDIFWAFLVLLMYLVDVSQSDCKFPRHGPKVSDKDLQRRIQPLVGKTYFGTDRTNSYKYFFGVCTLASNLDRIKALNMPYGMVQETQNDETKKFYGIGQYTNSTIIQGRDWVILEYLDGQPYGSHCGSEPRRARVMFNCDSSVAIGDEQLVIYEEENNKTQECFYLFEMKTSVVCPTSSSTPGLSIGSILVIVFVCVLSLYLILGCAYMRFVLHAKGKEQCPNYSFWQDFGNLQADGCDLVCRSKTSSGSRSYKGIGDDQLEGEEDKDDHLLPM